MTEEMRERKETLFAFIMLLEQLAKQTAGNPNSRSGIEPIKDRSKFADDETCRMLLDYARRLTTAHYILEPILAASGPAAINAMLDALSGAAGIGLLHRGSPAEEKRKKSEKLVAARHAREARTRKTEEASEKVRKLALPLINKHRTWTTSRIEKEIRPKVDKLFGSPKPARSTVMSWIKKLR